VDVTDGQIELLKAVAYFYAVRYNELAAVLYKGDPYRTYKAVDPLIRNGFLKQKRDPNNRRRRVLMLTEQGARAIGVPKWLAYSKKRQFTEALENNEFYIRALRAGMRREDILSRQEALEITHADKRYVCVNWGIKTGDGVHFVYVRHNWVRKKDIMDSLIYGSNKALSHTVVCRTTKGLWHNLNWFAKQPGLPAINIITLEDVPSYVAWLKTEFAALVNSVMAELSPGGRCTYADLTRPVALAWEQPGRGRMLLADLRTGDLHTLLALRRHDFDAAPVTAFTGTENQARRWAAYLKWPEKLWFVVCGSDLQAGLYQVSAGKLVLRKLLERSETA